MALRTSWLPALLLALLFVPSWLIGHSANAHWTTERKRAVREQVRELWYHGFTSYMRFAFPLDELTPLSCSGRGPDWDNPANIAYNDVASNTSITLVDSLDTLVILGDVERFEKAVRDVIRWVSYDVNTKPQVFETTIRALGGLLSGHIFASEPGQDFYLPWYRGELLSMAHDLGERLLKAFIMPSGLPLARVNLRHGVRPDESFDTCTAGAGSLILEFATLSRLTGDDRFEKAAHKAFFALWNRKSDNALVGNTISTLTGKWTSPEVTGIGAGIDSFYEYALKWYVMSGEVEFLDVWQEAYAAIMRYSRAADGFWFRSVNIHTGDVAYTTTDSLSAFWPGLQVLAGDVQNAIKSHMMYWHLWKRHSGLPEVYDTTFNVATSLQYPLRPEFIESSWYLYRATRDPFYLDVGERVLSDITIRAKVDCGLTGIENLVNNTRDDRMESFVLSETLKYLYLLFDEDNPLHADDSNWVFTTEGHVLSLPRSQQRPLSAVRRKLRGAENLQCPAYRSTLQAFDEGTVETGLVGGIRDRTDWEYARILGRAYATPEEERTWFPDGWCSVPRPELYSYDFILSHHGNVVPEDLSPSLAKLAPLDDGFIIHNVSGIRTHIVSRLDGQGYDVTKLGPYAVRTGQIVYVNDSELALAPLTGQGALDQTSPVGRVTDVVLRFSMHNVDPTSEMKATMQDPLPDDLLVVAFTSNFGGNPAVPILPNQTPTLRFGRGEGMPIVRDASNELGCSPYDQDFTDVVLLVDRGDCTFLQKLIMAMDAGAAGVVVISDGDEGLNPVSDYSELDAAGEGLTDVALVVITKSDGALLSAMLDSALQRATGQLMLALEPEGRTATTGSGDAPTRTEDLFTAGDRIHVLYINGHPLQNTRLIV